MCNIKVLLFLILQSQQRFNLNCRSVMYFAADNFCVLADATKDSHANLYGPDPEGDYYEKNPSCAGPVDCVTVGTL